MKNTHLRKWIRLAITVALLPSLNAISAPENDYPSRPIKIVIPFPAGGSTDAMARNIGPALGKVLGQSIVIENKSGASGTVGADFVAKATPDGYTLLMGTLHLTIAQSVFPKLNYRIDKDLVPIGTVGLIPNVVVVNASVPANNIKELVALAKANPEKYDYASVGPGSAHHLIGEMFKIKTGANLTHIPYRGSAPAVVDLLGGQVSVMFDTIPSALPHIRDGKTKALAVTTAKRSSVLPNVPTLIESGIAIDVGTWNGLMAPAGTDPAIIDKLNRAIVTVLNDPDMRKQLQALGIEPLPSSPAELKARINKEIVDYSNLAKELKLSVE
ncbi:Bug family tripartite tricarboxylate transporter substrate binding protein [Polynucleobacter campilacus]|uniref:MFS transporter n=1 Tax=Polynucleobacter campilacus TaxID=1743163 RepID=A0A254PWS0_9BURK|nr:tripartite tricarboxylate transporter substrate binding protein [Polynucleobacter campilacus]OWS69746.1 MFS transporter [Polynucleobacter campilacus]